MLRIEAWDNVPKAEIQDLNTRSGQSNADPASNHQTRPRAIPNALAWKTVDALFRKESESGPYEDPCDSKKQDPLNPHDDSQ